MATVFVCPIIGFFVETDLESPKTWFLKAFWSSIKLPLTKARLLKHGLPVHVIMGKIEAPMLAPNLHDMLDLKAFGKSGQKWGAPNLRIQPPTDS